MIYMGDINHTALMGELQYIMKTLDVKSKKNGFKMNQGKTKVISQQSLLKTNNLRWKQDPSSKLLQ